MDINLFNSTVFQITKWRKISRRAASGPRDVDWTCLLYSYKVLLIRKNYLNCGVVWTVTVTVTWVVVSVFPISRSLEYSLLGFSSYSVSNVDGSSNVSSFLLKRILKRIDLVHFMISLTLTICLVANIKKNWSSRQERRV